MPCPPQVPRHSRLCNQPTTCHPPGHHSRDPCGGPLGVTHRPNPDLTTWPCDVAQQPLMTHSRHSGGCCSGPQGLCCSSTHQSPARCNARCMRHHTPQQLPPTRRSLAGHQQHRGLLRPHCSCLLRPRKWATGSILPPPADHRTHSPPEARSSCCPPGRRPAHRLDRRAEHCCCSPARGSMPPPRTRAQRCSQPVRAPPHRIHAACRSQASRLRRSTPVRQAERRRRTAQRPRTRTRTAPRTAAPQGAQRPARRPRTAPRTAARLRCTVGALRGTRWGPQGAAAGGRCGRGRGSLTGPSPAPTPPAAVAGPGRPPLRRLGLGRTARAGPAARLTRPAPAPASAGAHDQALGGGAWVHGAGGQGHEAATIPNMHKNRPSTLQRACIAACHTPVTYGN
jgi:hypothetical protein